MTPCILWTKYTDTAGYGHQRVRGKSALAHRAAYAKANGLDVHTMGGTVMHSCDVRNCVNPAHLSMGTQQDNMDDMVTKGRASRKNGEVNGRAVLTIEQVRWVRLVYKARDPDYGGAAIARKLGVAPTTISRIILNDNWSDT